MISLDTALARFFNVSAVGPLESFALLTGGLLIVAVFALAFIPWITKGLWQITARAAGASIIAFAVSKLLKDIIARPRPFAVNSDIHQLILKDASDPAFPSSHASVAFAVAFVLFDWNRRWGIIALILAVAVGIGRVMVGLHYPSDVLGGALIGFVSAWLVKRWSQQHHAGSRR